MSLIEAIKSGRPFKRKVYEAWLECEGTLFLNANDWSYYHLTVPDVLANDWEVKSLKSEECLGKP